jgi:hypothetical protein
MDETNTTEFSIIKSGFNWKHAALLLLVLFAALFPFYQYIFDIDAIGYITVARHYAAGEWSHAINGYWSPLNSLLMVPLLKMGLNDVLCFKIANAFFGIGVLYQTEKVLNRFLFSTKQKTWILLTVMVMALYYASVQLAADMLFVWIFLMYINVVLKEDLDTSLRSNFQAGVIAAIAFFAKTYGGVFFILHFSFIHFVWFPFIQKKGWHLQKYVTGLFAFFPLIIVWMLLLWNKYHIITFGYSGKLNWSWVLKNGQPDYTAFFYQPPYEAATSRWADPFYSQAKTYSPFQSKEMFLRGMKLVVFNIKNGIIAALWISFLSPLLLVWLLIKRKAKKNLFALAAIIVLFPLIYLLIFIEERYLWPVSVLLLIASCFLLQQASFTKKWMWPLILLSFVTGPIIRLIKAINNDKEAHELTAIIRQNNLSGPFTSTDLGEWMHKAAFHTGNQFLGIANAPKSWEQLETECKNGGVKTVCIQTATSEKANEFLASDFYKKYKAHSYKIKASDIWIIDLR